MDKGFPFDWLPLQRFADSGHLFRLEIVDFPLLNFGQCGLACHVKWHKSLLLCLAQYRRDQPMVFNDGLWGQCTVVLLYGESLIHTALQGLRNGLCGLCVDRLTLYGVIYCPERNARRIGDTGPC